MVVVFLPVWAEGDCIGARLHSCNAVITINIIIIITLVQRYTKNITSLFPSVLYECPA